MSFAGLACDEVSGFPPHLNSVLSSHLTELPNVTSIDVDPAVYYSSSDNNAGHPKEAVANSSGIVSRR